MGVLGGIASLRGGYNGWGVGIFGKRVGEDSLFSAMRKNIFTFR